MIDSKIDTIDRVEVATVVIPLEREFLASTYSFSTRATTVVRAWTRDGLVSVTYTGDPKRDPTSVSELLVELLERFVIGRPVCGVAATWRAMMQEAPSTVSGTSLANYMRAIAAVDTMFWDLLGRRSGLPCYNLWGGVAVPIPVICIGGYQSAEKNFVDAAVEEALQFEAAGFGGMKLKVGAQPFKDDLARVSGIREACQPGFQLVCDANQAWSLAEAKRFAHAVGDLNLAWLEEPCRHFREPEHGPALRLSTAVPVGSGQSEVTPFDAVRLIRHGAVDVLNFDASCGGGPTGWRIVDSFGYLSDITMGHHEEAQVASHLLSATASTAGFVEYFPPERDPMLAEGWVTRPEPICGSITPGSAPGFGIVLDEAFVNRYTVLTACVD